MLLDDAEADAQAETGTLTRRVRRIERIENTVGFLMPGPVSLNKTNYPAAIARGLDGESATAVGDSMARLRCLMMLKKT